MDEQLDGIFRHPIARRYADLAGVKHDLDLTKSACHLFASRPTVGSDDNILLSRSVGTFAIVTYCRTLASGVRSGILKEMIDDLPAELRGVHDEVKAIRDKFVAHSVNFDEDNVVDVQVIFGDSGEMELDALGTTHTRIVTFSYKQMHDLNLLVTALEARLQIEIDTEHSRVWNHLASLTPADLQASLSVPHADQFRPRDAARHIYGTPGS